MQEIARAILSGRFTPLRELLPEAPEELDLVLRQMLMVEPAYRTPTMERVAEDFEAILAGRPAGLPALRDPLARFLPGLRFAGCGSGASSSAGSPGRKISKPPPISAAPRC